MTSPHGIVESADIIISIMVISGVLYVIEQTGAISAALQRLTAAARGKEVFVVLGLTLVFGVLGVIGWGGGRTSLRAYGGQSGLGLGV